MAISLPYEQSGLSLLEKCCELVLPLVIVILIVIQMILLPALWSPKIFKRWLVVISAVFALFTGHLIFIDIIMAVFYFAMYLFVVGSWLIGFKNAKNQA
ncbi:MAG: hypothetical protein V4727_14400 [Verrucomicrobiota bacterium]